MTDQPPLIFGPKLGGLYPVNLAAKEAVKALGSQVTVKLSGMSRNQRRRSLYWIVTGKVTEIMNETQGFTFTEQDMHDIIRKKLGYYDETTLPSGDIHQRLKSTNDRNMSEQERAEFTTRAFTKYASWLGISVEDLTQEETP